MKIGEYVGFISNQLLLASSRLYFYPACGRIGSVKKLYNSWWDFCCLGPPFVSAQTAFTSLYIFGDGVSTTTTNSFAGPLYYGRRFSNGRVWVEVLAQQLGLTNNYWYSTNGSPTCHTPTCLRRAPTGPIPAITGLTSRLQQQLGAECRQLQRSAKCD